MTIENGQNIIANEALGLRKSWLYSDKWKFRANLLYTVYDGSNILTYDGRDTIYASLYTLVGEVTTVTMIKYSLSTNIWTDLANDIPKPTTGDGRTLCYDGSDSIYILYAGIWKTFKKYSISGDNYTALTDTPDNVGGGGSMCYDGNDTLYVLRGTWNVDFYAYSISGNSWSSKTSFPQPDGVGIAGAIVFDGNNYIYGFSHRYFNNSLVWARYDIAENDWTTLSTVGLPSGWSTGTPRYSDATCAVFIPDGRILVSRGSTTDFYLYSIASDTWTQMAAAPGNLGFGLVLVGNSMIYAVGPEEGVAFYRYIL